MDIDLLSKMVKELILDNDRVVLPGLGYFAAEIVPSTFSDRGYTINPPYRKLYFRQDMGRDGLLARLYSESNGTGTDVAEHILEDFVRDMREVLDREKVIIFPGLGRLRATKENNYFFVPDEDLDIYPEGAGLEPVSLKTHNVPVEDVEVLSEAVVEASVAEENVAGEGDKAEDGISGNEESGKDTVEEDERKTENDPEGKVEEKVSGEPEYTEENAGAGKEEPGTGENVEEKEAEEKEDMTGEDKDDAETGKDKEEERMDEDEDGKRKNGMPKWLRIMLIVFGAAVAMAVIALAVFVLLANVSPDFVDSILYSPDELEILKY